MEKYITKFDYAHSVGFQVRVPSVENGVLLPYQYLNTNRFFKKGVGTWIEALDLAMIWRDKYLIEHNVEYLMSMRSDKQHPMTRSSCNTSGVIGVSIQTTYKTCGVYQGYKAFWSDGKKQLTRQFSINLYGEVDAFLKACRVRFKHAGVLIITDLKAIPCLPDVDYKIKEKT